MVVRFLCLVAAVFALALPVSLAARQDDRSEAALRLLATGAAAQAIQEERDVRAGEDADRIAGMLIAVQARDLADALAVPPDERDPELLRQAGLGLAIEGLRIAHHACARGACGPAR